MMAVLHGGSPGTECDVLAEIRVWLSVQTPLLFLHRLLFK